MLKTYSSIGLLMMTLEASDMALLRSLRRQNVDQAIMCPGCGVALGIPAVRPIKVTCPQCMQETTFSS